MTDKEVQEAFRALNEYDCSLECTGCKYNVTFSLDDADTPFRGGLSFCIFAAVEKVVENQKRGKGK